MSCAPGAERLGEKTPATGLPKDADASMLLRRLRVYDFRVRLPPLAGGGVVDYCPRCFADFVLSRQ